MARDGNKVKEDAIKIAKEIGMPEDEFNKRVEKSKKEMETRNIPEDQMEYYVYKRVLSALKLKIRDAATEAEGFLIGQKSAMDFARVPRAEIDEYIEEKGTEKAIEFNICNADLKPLEFFVNENNQPVMESEGAKKVGPLTEEEVASYIIELGKSIAQEYGKLDAKGNYIYPSDAVQWKRGKIIPQHEYQGTLYGLFKMPGDKTPKVTEITIKGEAALESMPLFKIIKIPVKVNTNKSTSQKYVMNTQRTPTSVGEDIDYLDYDQTFRKAYPDKRLDTLDELDDFLQTHEKYDWCIVDADITEVGTTVSDYDSVTVTIANIAASSRQQIKEITLFVDVGQAKGLIETSDAVMVISPKEREDGSITGALLGCYIDPFLRPIETEDISEDGVLDPF